MKRLKIVQLSKECSANGGVGVYLLRLCPALAAAGHEVAVIHADPNLLASPPGASRHFYVEGFDQFTSEGECQKRMSRVVEILESIKPDIIHIQGNNNFLLEAEIRRRFYAVKSLHVYDFCPSGNKFHHALQRECSHATGPMCMVRMGYKRCLLSKRPSVIWWHYRRAVEANRNNADYSKLIVASEYVKQQAVATGYPSSQTEVLPYFTNLPDISVAASNTEKTILFVGRVVREKGLDHLLSALSLVRPPWRLIVDGDGQDSNRVKQIAQQLQLADRIEFVGWAQGEQHLQLYRQASLVIVPSIWPEPFGLVGIEAMSYAKPVVAFDVGGISQWLEDKVTGFLVAPYDVDEMAGRIDYLLNHQQAAAEMGKSGRKKVEREFTEEKHVENLLGIYKEVMNGRNQLAAIAN